MRTVAYDFRSFVADGQLVRTSPRPRVSRSWSAASGAVVAGCVMVHAYAKQHLDSDVVAVMAGGPHPATSIDHAFDPVISMLQQMSFPVATIVIAWACLRAMTGHPAQAVDQAKWAVLGYLAMRYAPEILRHI